MYSLAIAGIIGLLLTALLIALMSRQQRKTVEVKIVSTHPIEGLGDAIRKAVIEELRRQQRNDRF